MLLKTELTKKSKEQRHYEEQEQGHSLLLVYWYGLELEEMLIQTQMTQKPMRRAEVCARALRASPNKINNREEYSVKNALLRYHTIISDCDVKSRLLGPTLSIVR